MERKKCEGCGDVAKLVKNKNIEAFPAIILPITELIGYHQFIFVIKCDIPTSLLRDTVEELRFPRQDVKFE